MAWSATDLQVPLRIRLVKGAYWDHEEIVAASAGWPSPVFAQKSETDANFERCTKFLIDHAGEVRPAIASHNLRSLAHAIVYAERRELGPGALELQLLYGMAEPVHAALVREGHRVRVYAPVGELVPGIAYLVRRLLENTSNESFVRHRFAEGRDLDQLIRAAGRRRGSTRRAAGRAAPAARPTRARRRRSPTSRSPSSAVPARVLRSPAASVMPRIGSDSWRPSSSTGRRLRPTERSSRSILVAFDRVVCRSGCADRSIVDAAIDVAASAWPAWRAAPWEERAAILFRAAAILRARRVELAALEVFEAGKPIAEADADVCEAIDFCEYYGREALRLSGRRAGRTGPRAKPTRTPTSRAESVR